MAKVDSTASFYVYVHRRGTDGRVFYVGKGKGRRAWVDAGRTNYWRRIVAKHGLIVEIVQDNMQEWWAFEMERELIALYGRKNLCNLTDGGEGASGAVKSAETIAKHIALHTGKKRSAESRQRMSDAQKSSPNKRDISGDKNPAKREEVRAKMRGDRPSIKGEKNVMNRPEVKAKFVQIVSSQDYKKKMSISVTAALSSPEVRAKLSASSRKSFQNPDRLKQAQEHMQNLATDPKTKAKMIESRKKFYEENGNKVICINMGEVFSTVAASVVWLRNNGFPKATATRVAEVAKGKRKSAYGFTWRYA